ncbi:leukemia NUP98 fusion partner 1 [Acipenser oxyrinchus oxyrinchus]|uniref:Leukemia NUP98 fusion partner 1 n=1 Tax=Acipenser oxyrinchus oxyrinchus TaxID=40147 RepID=A0AAD8G6U9_ACIOX|nr:leukemia NUP98 fusion partner 1 [Acipenser oxyrinchus oxyrinchus]
MEHEEDEDVNFAKWMSSFWGHSGPDEAKRDRRASWRRKPRVETERRASLPCPAQLSAMHLTKLQVSSMGSSPVYLQSCKEPCEEKEFRGHMKVRRASSSGETRRKASVPENRIGTIHELSESFKRKLRFHSRQAASQGENDDPCVICHDDLKTDTVTELHCMHKFHKEYIEKWLWKKQTCPMYRVQVFMPEPFYWSSARMKWQLTRF